MQPHESQPVTSTCTRALGSHAPFPAARHLIGAALLSTASLLLAGCGQVSGSGATQYAQLRVIDAASNAGGVDVYVGSTPLTYNIGFGSVVAYTPVLAGSYTVSVHASGSRTVLTSATGALSGATQYTLLLGNSSTGTQSQLLTDASNPAPGMQSLLRIVHQASQVGPVDVYLLPSGAALTHARAIATSVAFNSVRASIGVPSGTYQLVLLPAGTVPAAATATAAATVPLYTGTATALPGGSDRTIVLFDTQLTSSPAVSAIILSDYDSPYF